MKDLKLIQECIDKMNKRIEDGGRDCAGFPMINLSEAQFIKEVMELYEISNHLSGGA